MAFCAAVTAMSTKVSFDKMRLSFTPVRVEIHSSFVSKISESMSLLTTKLGTELPVPIILIIIILYV